MIIKERINRWRHDRGYGVHSPLAFRIVRDVLSPQRGYSLYGYDDIASMFHGGNTRLKERRGRFLLRLGAGRQPSTVWHSSGFPKEYLESLKLAGGIIRIYDGEIFPEEMMKAEMILVEKKLPKDIGKILKKPGIIVVCLDVGEKNVARLAAKLDTGVMFDAVDSAMIITGSGISPMVYTVSKWKI